MTLTKDSSGRYFMSFVVDTNPDVLPELDTETGIDLGLGHFAVLVGGTKVDSSRFLRRAEKKLARAKIARQYARVADRRRDWLHKLSTDLKRDHRAIYVEDLAVKGMARTRLAKPCTMRGGRSSSRCRSTRPPSPAVTSRRSAGSSRPLRSAPPAGSRTAPSP
ncbi:RNA-guided endonuclease InsQ/TnpB family protein [Streptomyces sp. NPDC008343]|uniref:RNA-guided endonuclease InsQ/TnpB family protein n=1 Tax=Streptomyces sp. NPDC008343 TaxID=3364828 RepID=UPI0036EE7CC4